MWRPLQRACRGAAAGAQARRRVCAVRPLHGDILQLGARRAGAVPRRTPASCRTWHLLERPASAASQCGASARKAAALLIVELMNPGPASRWHHVALRKGEAFTCFALQLLWDGACHEHVRFSAPRPASRCGSVSVAPEADYRRPVPELRGVRRAHGAASCAAPMADGGRADASRYRGLDRGRAAPARALRSAARAVEPRDDAARFDRASGSPVNRAAICWHDRLREPDDAASAALPTTTTACALKRRARARSAQRTAAARVDDFATR